MKYRTPRQPDAISALESGVLILSGYGLRLGVDRGHLITEDGIGVERRRIRFSRLDQALKRVVIIGHAGTISLDAIRWLDGVGVPLIHLDTDGRVFFVASPAAAMDPKLRRAQALAADGEFGLHLSREIVQAKIEAQRQLFLRITGDRTSTHVIDRILNKLSSASTSVDIRALEARAAQAYWSAWKTVPIRFAKGDASRVPRHWRAFDGRTSVLGNSRSPRKAINPINAVLNYLYAILEAEMRIATLAAGLDPVLGFMHRDVLCRDSMVLDLMEPIRPAVDMFVLDFLADHTFTRTDLFEYLDGQCRLLPPLTHQLAATAPLWARLALPEARRLAQQLLESKQVDTLEKRPKARIQDKTQRTGRPRGTRSASIRNYTKTQTSWDTTTSTKRRHTLTQVIAADRAWHGPKVDPVVFRKEIWPGLKNIRLIEIERVTGLSNGACSNIRTGKSVPHRRHWQALAKLANIA